MKERIEGGEQDREREGESERERKRERGGDSVAALVPCHGGRDHETQQDNGWYRMGSVTA